MTNAKIALQLSSREGFEVKVSEALHAGCPVVTTCSGGIPLQVSFDTNSKVIRIRRPIGTPWQERLSNKVW